MTAPPSPPETDNDLSDWLLVLNQAVITEHVGQIGEPAAREAIAGVVQDIRYKPEYVHTRGGRDFDWEISMKLVLAATQLFLALRPLWKQKQPTPLSLEEISAQLERMSIEPGLKKVFVQRLQRIADELHKVGRAMRR